MTVLAIIAAIALLLWLEGDRAELIAAARHDADLAHERNGSKIG